LQKALTSVSCAFNNSTQN